MAHTPGPWHWVDSVDDKPYVFGGKNNGWPSLRTAEKFGENKTEVRDGGTYTSFALPIFVLDCDGPIENEANAHLIAAAPELLALVQRYASECAECGGKGWYYVGEGVSGSGPDDIEPEQAHCPECADIRAVIAKAVTP